MCPEQLWRNASRLGQPAERVGKGVTLSVTRTSAVDFGAIASGEDGRFDLRMAISGKP